MGRIKKKGERMSSEERIEYLIDHWEPQREPLAMIAKEGQYQLLMRMLNRGRTLWKDDVRVLEFIETIDSLIQQVL